MMDLVMLMNVKKVGVGRCECLGSAKSPAHQIVLAVSDISNS